MQLNHFFYRLFRQINLTMRRIQILTIIFLIVFSLKGYSQAITAFTPQTLIPVVINGDTLKNPWVGGFNTPLFSTIDLNGDGIKDLFVFDKDGDRITTYINNGIAGEVSYSYAPEYQKRFPASLHAWALLYDFDCDTYEDIITYTSIGGMEVWHNDYDTVNGLSFSLYSPLIYSHYGPNYVNLYVSQVNLPALSDVDNDGDMDVLTFAITGNNVEYHENKSMDSLGKCGLIFNLEDDAWGHFLLSGLTNTAILGVAKPGMMPSQPVFSKINEDPESPQNNRHSGACLLAVDFNGNNVKDLINGDILGNTLLYLENTGTTDSAYVSYQDTTWPSYNVPVNFFTFPAAYNFDVDNDGAKDIVVTSCTANTSENFNNILFYKNIGTTSNAVFDFQKNTLFQDEMIEVGSGANVTLFDANNDGLKDLIIGNYGYFSPTPPYISGLSYYKNTGTATTPAFELVTRDYMHLNALNITGIYPAFGDIDGDGDEDMILGDFDGFLQLFLNTAGPGNVPNFPTIIPNFLGIDVGLHSAPQIIDVDRDGMADLVIGERQGNLNYYHNDGAMNFSLVSTTFGNVDVVNHAVSITGFSNPVMIDINGNYELFVGSESGYIYHYTNIDNNLTGPFTLLDSMYKNIFERPRITIALADINNDSLMDIFTGNGEGGVKFYYQEITGYTGLVEPSTDDGFYLFPNPATDQLLVRYSKADNYTIEIFNLPGALVYQSKENRIQKRIQINNLPAGMYIVKVRSDNKTFNKKFIINR